MARVLIPFSKPDGAERAIALLLDNPDRDLSVHLLAAVEPRVSGKVMLYVSPARAEAQVIAAAKRWLARLEPRLTAAGIACTSEIAVGSPRESIRAATARADVDRVVLPAPEYRWMSRREREHIEQQSRHPVTLVA
ncbi:MAG: universal stress protein [Casimicrobiaceae bacterium]